MHRLHATSLHTAPKYLTQLHCAGAIHLLLHHRGATKLSGHPQAFAWLCAGAFTGPAVIHSEEWQAGWTEGWAEDFQVGQAPSGQGPATDHYQASSTLPWSAAMYDEDDEDNDG
jgi:hypothetical protein